MALDELGDQGVRLNVNVYDSKASENTVRDLLRTDPDLPNSHLIIGPYRRQNVQKVADYAKKENITFISPYSASGMSEAILANRISYFFGFDGPSVTMNTACSSSLVALDAACKSISFGDCNNALSGGVALYLNHLGYIAECKVT